MAEQIGRYEIRREIGRGGMATVYLAFDPRIQRQVAIKVLPRQFTHNPRYLDRFQQEAHMIAALEHPAIVPIHDFGEHNDAPYLVMRYMAGGNLRNRFRGEPFSLEDITAALDRLAPALDYAHKVGVVHRDLKPANILFDHQGNPYLADFGIARMAEASQTMTIIGTPAYMSPEQVESEVRLDGRSDIYALGIILYELLTGKQPYTAETPTGQMLMHITKPVPNILRANSDLPPETQQVIEKAMAKDREERYQNAAELATAVNLLLDAESASSENGAAVKTVAFTAGVFPDKSKDMAVSQSGGEEVPIGSSVLSMGGSGAAPPIDMDGKSDGLPGWVWWVGALALLVIVGLGIRAIFGGGDDEATSAATATETVKTVVAAALTENTLTATPVEYAGAAGQPTGDGEQSEDEVGVTATAIAQSFESPSPTEQPSKGLRPTPKTTETPTEESNHTPTVDPNFPPLVAELGNTWERTTDGMTMVYVPEGSFMMGSEEGDDNEKPVHEVSLDAFWIDRTEVTNSQFTQFVEDKGYETTAENEGSSSVFTGEEWENLEGANWQYPQGPESDLNGLAEHPVIHVSWFDAEAYCEWAGGRLPTEAEWEFAARGPQGLVYPWGNSFDGEKANYCDVNCPRDGADEGADDGYEFTAPVGSYPAGETWSGALDISGNVWEWVSDWYGETYYEDSPGRNPQGLDSGDYRVLRGGAWSTSEIRLRGAHRTDGSPDVRFGVIGFRCVVSPGV